MLRQRADFRLPIITMKLKRPDWNMLDRIIAIYWTPKGMPLWKHHLPSILIGVILVGGGLAITTESGAALIAMFIVLVGFQFIMALISRWRFGNTPPPGSNYRKN